MIRSLTLGTWKATSGARGHGIQTSKLCGDIVLKPCKKVNLYVFTIYEKPTLHLV